MRRDVVTAQPNRKAVGRVAAAPQLAGVSRQRQDLGAGGRERIPVRAVATRAPHAERLCRDRMPVLEAAVADVFDRDTRVPCELPRDPGRVGAGLADDQEIVFTVAAGLEPQHLIDDEIGGRLADNGAAHGFAVRACPVRNHASRRRNWP